MVEEQQNSTSEYNNNETVNDEVAACKKELTEMKAKAETNLAGWQRSQADYTNYKRRSEQEKEETVKFANSMLITRILPIIDDFERAISSLPSDICNHPWVEGMKIIERKMKSVLESQGVTPVKAVGEAFDPRIHEAVRQVSGPEGIVIDEAQKGYKFYDRIIRPSQVAVGNGEPVSKNDEDTQKDVGAV